MLLSHLKQIVDHFLSKEFIMLDHIRRCENNILELCFDHDYFVYIDLQKGNSTLFKKNICECENRFNAAFDTILAKRFRRTRIEKISLVDGDKVLRLDVSSKGSYKEEFSSIQFEFTGRYTNAVILDSKEIVLEALRHIDKQTSSRSVRVGEPLLPIPKADFTPKEDLLEDVEAWLLAVFTKRNDNAIEEAKKIKLVQLGKQLSKIKKERKSLQTPESLEESARQFQIQAELILANMYQIKPYSQKIELNDYEGDKVTIIVDKAYAKPSDMAKGLYNKAKKMRQKAKHLYIEEENLEAKQQFLERIYTIIEHSHSIEEINRLLPKQSKTEKKDKSKPYEVFWFDTYKVMLGRNEKANQMLLEESRANDIWFHLKDRASAHVMIKSDKQKIPQAIIEQAARLCVDFSVTSPGRFSVDYTRRRELQLQEGANLFYNKYETIIVQKE